MHRFLSLLFVGLFLVFIPTFLLYARTQIQKQVKTKKFEIESPPLEQVVSPTVATLRGFVGGGLLTAALAGVSAIADPGYFNNGELNLDNLFSRFFL